MECFIVPVLWQTPQHEFQTRRCLQSIRTFYPHAHIILAVAKNSLPLTIETSPTLTIVENPGYSTIGCIELFHKNKYATFAHIIHDSMTIVKPIPVDYSSDVQFYYTFVDPYMSDGAYHADYEELMGPVDHADMVRNYNIGCFGAAVFLRHSAIEPMGVLPYVAKVNKKSHHESMERILSYLAFRSNSLRPNFVLCGRYEHEHFSTWPWRSNMSFEEMLKFKTPYSVLKVFMQRP